MKNKKFCIDDLKMALSRKENVRSLDFVDKSKIIDERRFNDYIRMIMLEKPTVNEYELLQSANYRYDEAKVTQELLRMQRTVSTTAVKSLFLLFSKMINHIVSGIYVNTNGIKKTKIIALEQKCKSYLCTNE